MAANGAMAFARAWLIPGRSGAHRTCGANTIGLSGPDSDTQHLHFKHPDRHELDAIGSVEHDIKCCDLFFHQRKRLLLVAAADMGCQRAMRNPRTRPIMLSTQRRVYQPVDGRMSVTQRR